MKTLLIAVVLSVSIDSSALCAEPDYILWSGHRYARTPEDVQRDVQYFRDLGFNYSLIGNLAVSGPAVRNEVMMRALFKTAEKHQLNLGVRISFERDTETFAEAIGLSEAEMIAQGILLWKRPPTNKPAYNPMHPEVIRFYSEGFARQVAEIRKLDSGGRLRMFLIGTEMGWPLPKSDAAAHPAAVRHILTMAQADGVQADSLNELGAWWTGAHQKGGDWRVRQAIEAAVLERVPQATFWVDPIWAIKIVNGFGGQWSYVNDDPKRIIPGLINTQAMTRPAPAAHSTQLTRKSGGGKIPHDVLLEANLISLCLGIDKLYHWGIQKFEPGTDPFYGSKTLRPSPEGFPQFSAKHIKDWPALVKALSSEKKSAQIEKVWALLGKDVHKAVSEGNLLGILDGDLLGEGKGENKVSPALQKKLLAALNGLLRENDWTDASPFSKLVAVDKRLTELRARTDAVTEDGHERARLILEKVFGPLLVIQTKSPNVRALWEDVDYRRRNLEPAIRTTGRLLKYRGELFSRWKPLGPRVALLSGLYSGDDLKTGLVVGHIPYDLLRNQDDRRRNLKNYRWAAVTSRVSTEDYQDLLVIESAGGTVLVPEGFEPPAGQAQLKRAVTWKPGKDTKGKLAPHELRMKWHAIAENLREQFHQAGFKPYADTSNLNTIVQSYQDGETRLVFVVNDKRSYSRPKGGVLEDRGESNPIELTIRDPRSDLRAVDIDTGEVIAMNPRASGWTLRDTLPAAWYRIYAILPSGKKSSYPVLPLGPEITNLKAKRNKDSVELSWNVPFEDWVGADLQRYRVYRAAGEASPQQIAEISARPLRGPGGMVTSYVDSSIKPGKRYHYQIQSVSALRRVGPKSSPVESQ